jgi:hypothetical protein
LGHKISFFIITEEYFMDRRFGIESLANYGNFEQVGEGTFGSVISSTLKYMTVYVIYSDCNNALYDMWHTHLIINNT